MNYKYAPLQEYLERYPKDKTEVTLSFRELEDLLGSSLPTSAANYQAWWGNQTDVSNRPQAKAWMNARFVVDAVHQGRSSGWVSFRRR